MNEEDITDYLLDDGEELKDIPLDKLPGTTVYEKSTGDAALVTSVFIELATVTYVTLKFAVGRNKITYPIFCGRYTTKNPDTSVKVGDIIDYDGKFIVLAIEKDDVWVTNLKGTHMTLAMNSAAIAKKMWEENK